MLSLSIKLPDGSKSFVQGNSVSDLWDEVWDVLAPRNEIDVISDPVAIANYCNSYSTLTGFNTSVATTATTNTGGCSIGGTNNVTNAVWIDSSPYVYTPYPKWETLPFYIPFQKLPNELCSNPSSPPVDIYKGKDKELHYLWAVAGYNLDDIAIEFEDGYLYLTLDKEEETKEVLKERVYLTKGIKSGKIENKYFLGEKYDSKKAVAKLREGILEVVIPMKEEEKPTKVKVTKE